MKSELTSDLFKGNDRLNACLRSDAANIRPNMERGPHVALIQQALGQMTVKKPNGELGGEKLTIAFGEISSQTYGPSTAAAVLRYKQDRQIIAWHRQQTADNIVGRMTIEALDNELGMIQPGPTPPPAPADETIQDVYIRISGFDNPGQMGVDQSDTANAKAFAARIDNARSGKPNIKPVKMIWFVGGAGEGGVVNKIMTAFTKVRDAGTPFGSIFIAGGSAGGPDALEVAANVSSDSSASGKIKLVGICDGAFQKADLTTPGQNLTDPETPLKLKSPLIQVDLGRKLNFFQSWGHTLDPNQELHGEVQGFTQRDLTGTASVRAVRTSFETSLFSTSGQRQRALEDAHKAAYFQAFTQCDWIVVHTLTGK